MISKIILMFKKTYPVSILNHEWNLICTVKLFCVPRKGEYIWLSAYKKYYEVLNIVHNIGKKHGIFVVVKQLDGDVKKIF